MIRFLKFMLRNLYCVHKLACRLKGRNKMFRDLNGNTFLNIAANLGSALLKNEGTKATNVHWLSFYQGSFHFLKKGLKSDEYVNFRNTRFFSNAADNVCFSHSDCVGIN